MNVLSPTKQTGLTYRFRNPKLAAQAKRAHAELLKHVGMEKAATIGGDQETSFEQAFASLAFTYIKDKAPRLLDYMVGFQLVDRNDDNTKAVGIFGFKIGKTWVYSPVFFLNGDLKGHELLYLKQQDMFVPLKENWVNYVLSKKPHVLGEGDPKSLSQMGVMQPDIRNLSIPPHNMKYGSARFFPLSKESLAGWLPVYGALTTGRGEYALQKFANFTTERLFQRVVRAHVDLCKAAMQICTHYPAIGEAMERFHGPDFFKQALLDMRKWHEKVAAKLREPARLKLGDFRPSQRPTKPTALGTFGRTEPVKFAAGPPVEIHVNDSVAITKNGPQLTEEEREKMLRDGHLIKDHRNGEEISRAYNTQIEVQLVNPDDSGLYSLVQKPGDFVDCLVIQNPHSGDGRKDFMTAIRLSPKAWLNAHPTALFGKPNIKTREDFEKWYDKQTEGRSLETDGVYVAVSRSGAGSVPFRVRESFGDGRYRVSFLDYPSRRRASYLPSMDRPPYRDWDSDEPYHEPMVYLNDREGTSFRSVSNTLYIPEEAKIFRVEKNKEPKKDQENVPASTEDMSHSEDEIEFVPGGLADLQAQIIQKTAGLKIYGDYGGNHFSVNRGHWLNKRASLFYLVRKHGFGESEALKMLKQATLARLRGKPAEFRVKYAGPYDQMVGQGPRAPAIPPPQYGFDSTYGNVPQQGMETYYEGVPELYAGNTDPQTYNPLPEATPDPMALQQAQQAGQMGQKEIFDTSMITGLLRAVRQDSLVDRYMGDLLKALDRLGRVLFMFYWHNDEFMDRYGKADMPELEDTLRNSFEMLGDLCLFLKEKDVKPLASQDLGEPNIEEAAG